MLFPLVLKEKLIECVRKMFDQFTLQTFTSKYVAELKEDFGQVTVGPGGGWEDYVTRYIDRLIKLETIHAFIEKLRTDEKTKDISHVKEFLSAYDTAFVQKGDKVVRNPVPFKSIIVQDLLPFVARDNVKHALYIMSTGQGKVMVLQGKPRCGLSYIQWYFSDIAIKTGCFDFRYIDLKKIKHELADGQMVTASHLAQTLLTELDIKDYNAKDYKYTQFLNRLKLASQDWAKNPKLIYIDHFDVLVANDVYELVAGLSKDFHLYNVPIFIALGGYENLQTWDPVVKLLAKIISIGSGSFSKHDIEDFFKKIYVYLSARFPLVLTQDEFVAEFIQIIPDELYNVPPDGSNVSEIGEKLSLWYRDFYFHLQTA